MKSYELKPTPENLLNTFLNDTISRDTDIFRFIDILNSIEDCCSIALDGNWDVERHFFKADQNDNGCTQYVHC